MGHVNYVDSRKEKPEDMPEKPLAFHLLMMKLLLGWKWIDADEKGCLKL